MRKTGNVYIIGRKIHKERLVFMLFDKIDGMNGDGIGNVLIFPKCLSTPFHKSDAADAIDDGHVMSVAGM